MTGRERAWAKLNLSLDVTGNRPDGYHELVMVMASVTLWDDVEVTLREDGRIRADCGLPWLPGDERNLAVKAARAFFAALGRPELGADIRIRKRIPVGAGMAGGSSDAAAVLRCLNRMTGAGWTADRLRKLGLELGSDVPYCVSGGMALARGRGELLTPLPPLPEACRVVICKPRFSLSTAELFGRVDSRTGRIHPDTEGLVSALEAGDLAGLARRMFNVFEEVLPRTCREVGEIRRALIDLGALGAVMTGTGSAVFGVFDGEETAAQARRRLGKRYRDCFLAKAIPEMEETAYGKEPAETPGGDQ